MCKEINVIYSSHRVEFLPLITELMYSHDVIILEEVEGTNFFSMLQRKVSIDQFLEENSSDFPEFSKRLYEILQIMHEKNKAIFPVEPYIERVIEIHTLLSEGKSIAEIRSNKDLWEVYLYEHEATGKLLDFYKASLTRPFDEVVEKVISFAKIEAERLRFRDTLRANKIIELIFALPAKNAKIYVEAGYIHQYLCTLLNSKLKGKAKVKKLFLYQEKIRELTGKPWLYPPGDILVLRFVYKGKENKELEKLLAARALIYIKLIEKRELLPEYEGQFPHLMEEIDIIQRVNQLSYSQCQALYEKMKFLDRDRALEILKFSLN